MLTDEQLDVLAAELPFVKLWVAAVEDEIQKRLEAGSSFTHASLTPKRALRKWAEGFDPVPLLTKFADLDKVAPRVPLSPSQAEKTLGRAIYQTSLAEHVSKVSSGDTLVFVP